MVTGDSKFLVWVDASGKGVGGGWLPDKDALEPTIWRLEWPKKLRASLTTPIKPGGGLYINDIEMAVNLLAWIVLEGIVGTENLHYTYVGLFSDNTTTVSWTQIGAAKNYA